VVHACNPSYSKGRDQEICGSKPILDKLFKRPYLEKNPSQERAGGVAQGVDPEFKTQYQNTQIYNNNVNKNFGLLYKILNLHVRILDPGDQMVRKRPAGSVRDMDPDLTHVSSSITVTFLFGLEH
jgi:hypothetical protein